MLFVGRTSATATTKLLSSSTAYRVFSRGVSRETPLEKTLYAVDELSSFVLAVALVRPTKSIHDVDVRAVKKKMKDKAFARAVNRDDIIHGAEHLGMPLDDVIAQVIAALKGDAERLGLVGAS